MLTNDKLAEWDRESFFHPSTHLGQFARGEAAQRIVTGGKASSSRIATATSCWTALLGSTA